MVFKKILVINSSELKKRRRLFDSLSAAYKIRFSDEFKIDEADGIISFNDEITKRYNKPVLFYFEERDPFVIKTTIHFKNAMLDGINYSNKSLYTDSIIITNALRNFRNDEIIAEQDEMVIWGRKEFDGIKHYYSVVAPKELMDYESIKHLFFCNDIISTLPLIAFIREIIKSGSNVNESLDPNAPEYNIPVLETLEDYEVTGSYGTNTSRAGVSSIAMDLISGHRLSPVKYFEAD